MPGDGAQRPSWEPPCSYAAYSLSPGGVRSSLLRNHLERGHSHQASGLPQFALMGRSGLRKWAGGHPRGLCGGWVWGG